MLRSIRSYSINSLLMMIFSLLFIIIVGFFSFIQYNAVAEDRISEFDDEIVNTNIFLNHSVSVLFEALQLYDSRYDYEMEMVLKKLSDSYVRSGRDISQINLSESKNEFAPYFPGDINLYIINSSNIVETTTYDPDTGLDFNQLPKFAKTLDTIRLGDRFVADQWVNSIRTPEYYQKYSYLPTSDHRYLLEIGINSDEFWTARRDIFSYEKLGQKILEINPDLVAISFFNKKLDAIDNKTGRTLSTSWVSEYIPAEELTATIKQTLRDHKNHESKNGTYVIEYQYYPVRTTLTPSSSEMDLVGVLVYSRDNLLNSLEGYLFIHLFITGLAIILSIIFAMYISRFISRPLEQIIGDIEQISRGDYHHRIRKTGGNDIDRLGSSVELMVRRILNDIEDIQKGHLEIAAELDRRKAAEGALIIANSKLNNLASITRHDILNQVTCIRAYAFLAENADDLVDTSHYSKDIQRLSNLIEEMIAFSRDYERVGINGSSWQNLDQVIYEARNNPNGDKISLQIEHLGVDILADPLLMKVFYNLIDNSLNHGGPGGEKIHIWFRKEKDQGTIVYEDQGKGVPDDDKENIFERGFGSGTGLGLFLIREILGITGMTIIETGTYGSGVRFEITVPPNQFRKTPDSAVS